jgi:hypothetical protein
LPYRSQGGSADIVKAFPKKERIMGKYVLAWLFGVPAFVLVIIYLIFN